jgi:type II secretory ATPase GspE/PulE/Tfp pilus assembly ATPase PilB-like protein
VEKEILTKACAAAIQQTAIKNGMKTLIEDAKQRVLEGKITPEEMVRVLGMDV